MDTKSRSRRVEIRKNRPDALRLDWDALRARGVLTSLGIAFAFFAVGSGILMMRQEVVRYRPNQWIPHDIVSRTDFTYFDARQLAAAQADAREKEPRVYVPHGDMWEDLRRALLALPDRIANVPSDNVPPDLAVFDPGAQTALRRFAQPSEQPSFERYVNGFIDDLKQPRVKQGSKMLPLIILPADERAKDLAASRPVRVTGVNDNDPVNPQYTYAPNDDFIQQTLASVAEQHFGLASLRQKI